MIKKIKYATLLISAIMVFVISCTQQQNNTEIIVAVNESKITDPLPSWNEGTSKQSIIDFVNKTTKESSADFVPVAERIACFDNDGTLWAEQPMYFQLAFAIDEVKRLSPEHPDWKTTSPFKELLDGDMKTFMSGGEKSLMAIMKVTHSGTSAEAFDKAVKAWMITAKHPKTGKHYNEMIYQPMVELLNYLRANDYKTFIVSGGGIDFIRAWAEATYGIPPNQVVGSSGKVKYEIINDQPVLTKLPEINFIDDKAGKPVGIHQYIGKRPVFTAGNSDGDYEMLQYTTSAGGYPRFGMIIHHTDSIREWAYDRDSHIGRLSKGLDDAAKNSWLIVDMKKDWNQIFPDK